MAYRPTFRKQADGTRCQWFNCNCASHCMAADRHRRGSNPPGLARWKPLPWYIRNRISGGCGGTSLNENANVLKSLYGIDMVVRYNVPWDTFRSMIISGRGAVVNIRYSVIAPTRFDASPGFTGGHAVYVNERRASDGAFLVSDPLADGRRAGIPEGPQWWSAALLKAACGAWTGSGLVDCSLTRDTEA